MKKYNSLVFLKKNIMVPNRIVRICRVQDVNYKKQSLLIIKPDINRYYGVL